MVGVRPMDPERVPMLKERAETTLTPPPPSSSPGFNDSMEISPLPHKAPFVVESQIEPTPEEVIIEDDLADVDAMQDTDSVLTPQPVLHE